MGYDSAAHYLIMHKSYDAVIVDLAEALKDDDRTTAVRLVARAKRSLAEGTPSAALKLREAAKLRAAAKKKVSRAAPC